jgi:SSS family solute:Na+ symporter
MAFLNRMAVTFAVLIVVMSVITAVKPLPEPKVISKTSDIDMTSSATVKIFGGIIVAVTVVLYIIFW